MLLKYRLIVNRAKTFVIHAFAACDLDGNKVCNLEEFILLNKHIEPESYDYKAVCKQFLENADVYIFCINRSSKKENNVYLSISSPLFVLRTTSSQKPPRINFYK